ncbi:MAG TPA: hypothetical protein VGT05_03310 [Patescibacteria group bacterium]|nr:hypothetical protein [Patescibacteria group bacterium]
MTEGLLPSPEMQQPKLPMAQSLVNVLSRLNIRNTGWYQRYREGLHNINDRMDTFVTKQDGKANIESEISKAKLRKAIKELKETFKKP